MKKFLKLGFAIAVSVAICSCESKQDIVNEKERLSLERDSLQTVTTNLSNDIYRLNSNKYTLIAEENDLKRSIIGKKQGKTSVYILRVSVRQLSYSLSISKQIRDAVNEGYFEIPVSEEYYKQCQVGNDLFDNFRWGSLVCRSSFGSWRLKVENKKIEYV